MTFLAGNSAKYIFRHKEKGGVEDLKKALVYLRWAIEDDSKPTLNGFVDEIVRDLYRDHIQDQADGVYEALEYIIEGWYEKAALIVEDELAGSLD